MACRSVVGGLTPWHLVLLLGVVLIVLGPGKLPQTGEAIGKALRSFRETVNEPTNPPMGGQEEPPKDR